MISNEERRKIAEFLRAGKCDKSCCNKCSGISEALFGNKLSLCDLASNGTREAWTRLADLIDRTTCRNECFTGEYFVCSNCRHEFPTLDDYGDYYKISYCPNCGAEVVG